MCYWLIYIIRYVLPESHEECEREVNVWKQDSRNKQLRIRELEKQLKQLGAGSSSSSALDDLNTLYIPPLSPQTPVRATPVPVFYLKNTIDLPNIFEVLNNNAMNHDPALSFSLEIIHNINDGSGGPLAVVLALCGTDRIDVTDRELVADLRSKKGFQNVLVFVLRRGNDPSKFKASSDTTINSGVGAEKALFQLLFYQDTVLEVDANQTSLYKFFQLTKQAYSQ